MAEIAHKRVVFVGGGHAHVQAIKALNWKARPSWMHVTLIDGQERASYSGMVGVDIFLSVAVLLSRDMIITSALLLLGAWMCEWNLYSRANPD